MKRFLALFIVIAVGTLCLPLLMVQGQEQAQTGGIRRVTKPIPGQSNVALGDPQRFRPGLRNSGGSRQLNARQLRMALDSLRHKTGFLEMRFDEAGFLTLGDRTRIAGGSATARALLIAAVEGNKVFELEDHSHSPRVAFASIEMGRDHLDFASGARITVQPLQLDFADFAQLRGGRDVIAAFDLGFIALHELGHGVLRLRDAANPAQLGECEEYINRIRRELGLPERQRYFTRDQLVTVSSGGRTAVQAELVFARAVEKQGRVKTEESYLRWETQSVGQSAIAAGPGSYHVDPALIIAKR
jgi:hypothetical protein